MKTLHTSKYITIELDEEKSIAFTLWQEATKDMTKEEYKIEMLKQRELITQYKVKYLYGDTTNFNFTISVALQEWINQNIFGSMYKEFEKCAVILSRDYIAQVSVELALDENTNTPFLTKYFAEGEKGKALRWLSESK